MTFEVESKYRVSDLEALAERLRQVGATIGEPIVQVDRYYAHPARDFAATDEALRLRRVGDDNCITYKGPKLDATTKTRREIELPLPEGDAGAEGFATLLETLGFRPVLEVRKRRREARVPWRQQQVTAALDEVAEVGTFVELELAADETELDVAREYIASLAELLGLTDGERRSYLELLLEAGPTTSG